MIQIPPRLVDAIRSFQGDSSGVIPPFTQCFSERVIQTVSDTVRTGWVSNRGEAVDQFELALSRRHNDAYVTATTSGTSALHLGLLASEIGDGDEVLVPAFTFVASANAILYCNAVPHIIEVDSETLCINPSSLRAYLHSIADLGQDGLLINKNTGRRIKAMIVVYPYGYLPDLPALAVLCEEFKLTLIEDASGALGSGIGDCGPGSWGRFACLSFNGNKILTTGGGGAVMCRNQADNLRVRQLATTAKHPKANKHLALGYNYRMPALNAGLGLAQLSIIDQKIALHQRYNHAVREALNGYEPEVLPQSSPVATSNCWVTLVRFPNLALSEEKSASRELRQAFNNLKITVSPVWRPLSRHRHLTRYSTGYFANAEQLASSTIILPTPLYQE